jgi:hypothetical protein
MLFAPQGTQRIGARRAPRRRKDREKTHDHELAARGKSLHERESNCAYVAVRAQVDRCSWSFASAPVRRGDRFWKSDERPQSRKERRGAALETSRRPHAKERAHQETEIQPTGMHQQAFVNVVVTPQVHVAHPTRFISYISEPDRGRRKWTANPDARAAVYRNRRRIRGARGKQLLRQRGERLERPCAHLYRTPTASRSTIT